LDMKINKENFNFYGFDIEKVCKAFEGDLKYIGTFCVKESIMPVAVFHDAKPNKRKGHKSYMLLWTRGPKKIYVSGMSPKEMENYRYQAGIYCPNCHEVIYSVRRYDYRVCSCELCSVDGGRDYLRTNGAGKIVRIDFINDKVEFAGNAS